MTSRYLRRPEPGFSQSPYMGAAGPDLLDRPLDAFDFHHVARTDGMFHEQDDAAHEIVDEVLAAEAHADGERAAQDGEERERDLHDPQSGQHEDDDEDVVGERLERCLHPGFHFESGEDRPGEEAA